MTNNMIKFFRHIRQRLISEGKTSRYLIYAAGEILLVVIGIILALQVNNWSNERAQDRRELKILSEMNQNLQMNINRFSDEIELQESIIQNIQMRFKEYLPICHFRRKKSNVFCMDSW